MHASQFGLPFEKATLLVHCPKALKRPRNNAGPAGVGLLIMKGIRHGHCIVNRFREVRTSQNRCEALFFLNRESHAVQI